METCEALTGEHWRCDVFIVVFTDVTLPCGQPQITVHDFISCINLCAPKTSVSSSELPWQLPMKLISNASQVYIICIMICVKGICIHRPLQRYIAKESSQTSIYTSLLHIHAHSLVQSVWFASAQMPVPFLHVSPFVYVCWCAWCITTFDEPTSGMESPWP